MEDFLFILMLIVFYFFSHFGRKKKPQAQRPPQPPQQRGPRAQQPQPVERAPSANTELDDALREIREALGWPGGGETRQPTPVEEPEPVAPSPVEQRPTRLEQRSREAVRREPRRSGPAADVPADVPNEFAAYTGTDPASLNKPMMKLPRLESPGAVEENVTHPLLARLRSPEGAREAVIYSEIFTPRWKSRLR